MHYSSVIPASLITLPMRASSSLMWVGELLRRAADAKHRPALRRCEISADLTALTISRLSLSMMARGVPAGATIPYARSCLIAGNSGFGNRGDIRERGNSLQRGDRKRSQPARFHVGKQRGSGVEDDLNLTAQEIV